MKNKFILFILIISLIFSCNFNKEKNKNIKENFVFVQGGTFLMGDELNANKRDTPDNDERPVHSVSVNSFWIYKHEVTQKEWFDIMGYNNSKFKNENNPVEMISWYEAVEFCNKLSKKEGLKPYYKINKHKKDPENSNKYDKIKWIVTINKNANGYRLPTEKEWEYAARYIDGKNWTPSDHFSGAKANIHNQKENNRVAWYSANSDYTTHPVMTKEPNSLGIYDMSGNVWEWCYDGYLRYPGNNDKSDYYSNSYKVLRGGAFGYDDIHCRVTNRTGHGAHMKSDHYGVRLVRDLF